MNKREIKQLLDHVQDERDGAFLYGVLAEVERDPNLAHIYRRFQEVEERHVRVFSERLETAGVTVPPGRPTTRTRILAWMARKFGPGVILQTVTGMERVNAKGYFARGDAGTIASEEAAHARVLEQIAKASPGGVEGSTVAQLEGRHRAAGGNALRAAVMGANDGLVSNLSLVMGVAGAELSGHAVLITGLAGLLAGACSMSLGEWLSVQSSRELYQRQLEIEAAEIENSPDEETEELALIYQSRGLKEAQARMLAEQIMENQESALQTLAREELNIDPEELGGSAYVAAITSFLLFAVGAIIPVFAFLFLSGRPAVVGSLGASAVGLFLIGGATSLFTGRGALFSGMRMVVFGLAAAALTFAIGRLIGVSVGG